MELKLTQFSQTPTIRSTVCQRCGYRMFQTKRFNWVCGPGCDGAEQSHQLSEVDHRPLTNSPVFENPLSGSKN